jgi:hypothetical protein
LILINTSIRFLHLLNRLSIMINYVTLISQISV